MLSFAATRMISASGAPCSTLARTARTMLWMTDVARWLLAATASSRWNASWLAQHRYTAPVV
jgi:hypothetical protein